MIATILGIAGILLCAYACYYAWQVLIIGAAYKAKTLCSSVFLSRRNPEDVLREDLQGIFRIFLARIDRSTRSVSASFPLIPTQHARFREGLGCTLVAGMSALNANCTSMAQPPRGTQVKSNQSAQPLLFVENSPSAADPSTLKTALQSAFEETDPLTPLRTRAVVIAYQGQIIAERYAPGIAVDTPLAGWSMAKSITNALVGILVMQGKLSIRQPISMPEWSAPGDARAKITLDQLLRMSSGLKFDDRTGPVLSDVNRMLFRSRDAAAYAVVKPLANPPDSVCQYSNGTTNIISRILRDTIGGSLEDYLAFPRTALFDKIGMHSAVLEPDASGTLVCSSFVYASARDWMRFGLLYLQDGLWEGERILPKGWVCYSSTPSKTDPQGSYGAHFRTNGHPSTPAHERPLPQLPGDTYHAAGYEGQNVVIIPSHELVVVRLGQTRQDGRWNMASFVAGVLSAMSGRD